MLMTKNRLLNEIHVDARARQGGCQSKQAPHSQPHIAFLRSISRTRSHCYGRTRRRYGNSSVPLNTRYSNTTYAPAALFISKLQERVEQEYSTK